MPRFITIGYGDRAGYDRTPTRLRDAAHAQDALLLAAGAVTGIAGRPVQVRNPDAAGVEVREGAFMTSDLPVAGFSVIEAVSLEDAIAEANRLPYGLAGYAFTRSIKNAQLLMNRMEGGMVWINQPATPSAEMPFGGIKDSGYGLEGGPEAMEG